MEGNLSCEEEGCLDYASHFYFKASNRKRICQNHLPSSEERLYPIEQFYFTTSPEDEAEYLMRSDQLVRIREYLRMVKLKAEEELKVAIGAIEEARIRAVEVVTESYDAEERRTRQHFNQVNVILDDFDLELSLYVSARGNTISRLLQKLVDEETIPCILRARVFNNDLELAKMTGNSCSRGELYLNKHLDMVLNPTTRDITAAILLQHAQKSAATEDFIELQKAFANCEDCISLREREDAKELRDALAEKIEKKMRERKTELIKRKTEDATSIKSLVKLCLENAENQKRHGTIQEVEMCYFKVTKVLLPYTQSKKAANAISGFADWYMDQGIARFKDAKKRYQQALAIYRPNFSTRIETANTLMNLGVIYNTLNRDLKAEQNLTEAIAMYRQNFSKTMNVATTFHNLGKLYEKVGRYQDAEHNYLEAFHISKAYHPTEVETATMSDNLGLFYEKQDRCVEAEQHYLEALNIYQLHSPTSIDTARANFHLGVISEIRYKYPEAEKYYLAALAIYQPDLSNDRAKALVNLGVLYEKMGRDNEAELSYLEALTFYKPSFPTGIDTATTFYSLGLVYEKLGQEEKAAENYLEALTILKPNHPTAIETANTLHNMGMLYISNGQYDEGRQSLEEALAIYEPNFPSSNQTANALYNLGLYCCITDNRSQAETHLKKALAIYDSNNENPGSERVVKTLVEFYGKNGDTKKIDALLALRQ